MIQQRLPDSQYSIQTFCFLSLEVQASRVNFERSQVRGQTYDLYERSNGDLRAWFSVPALINDEIRAPY